MKPSGLSRREVLGAGGATAAALSLERVAPAEAEARRRKRVKRADVAVIGAGISGLTAARRLVQAGVKSVVVLEANKRVGGRTTNLDVAPGVITEGGGEWVGPGQDHVLGLITELGRQTFNPSIDGNSVHSYRGTGRAFPRKPPPPSATTRADHLQME